jgi:UDP-glucose 4-epimerase
MSKILIVGGAGYIGSQTNYWLLERGYETVVFDNLVYGFESNIPKESIFINGDLSHIDQIKNVFESHAFDGVIDFAAYTYIGESVLNPHKYYQNNVVGTMNLLNVMNQFGVKNIVFSSTCATYGIPEIIPITENEKQNPINPYGFTKLVVERMLKDYSHAYGLNSIALRYFNACGADLELRTGESHNPETHLIPLIYRAIETGQPIQVFGNDYQTPDGTCIRDYVHTLDLASAHERALKHLLNGTIRCDQINIGTGKGVSVMEIINKVEEITGQKVPFTIAPRREGDPDKLVADNSKALEILNWKPIFSDLDKVISSSWNWYKKQHNIR